MCSRVSWPAQRGTASTMPVTPQMEPQIMTARSTATGVPEARSLRVRRTAAAILAHVGTGE